ncbi:MAG: hypothetical protein KKD76_05795 [Verrucomicrobia bacterium]|nr:hypothetical protein [Verrucomicrobiota bacterium]
MAWHSMIASVSRIRRLLKRLINITLFSVAMGYLEAVAVVYLRSILTRRADWLVIEITREFVTIVMLITFAVASGRNARERTGVFLLIFGIWDIVYYLGLWIWLSWPESLLTMDTLFYIPCVWASPVYVPICFSLVMMALGVALIADCGSAWIRQTAVWGFWGWLTGLFLGGIQAWRHGTSIPVGAMGMSFYIGLLAAGFGFGLVGAFITSGRPNSITRMAGFGGGLFAGLLAALGQGMFYSCAARTLLSMTIGGALGLAGVFTAELAKHSTT